MVTIVEILKKAVNMVKRVKINCPVAMLPRQPSQHFHIGFNTREWRYLVGFLQFGPSFMQTTSSV